jgi:lipoprotein-anchoring transpeptidase ErfK/SrfK
MRWGKQQWVFAAGGRPIGGIGVLLAMALAMAFSLLGPMTAHAQEWSPPRTVYMPSTGHTVDGLFLDAWRSHPALFGNPITEELTQATKLGKERDNIVQYYDNLALVYLPEMESGWRVQALQLGREALERDLKTGGDPALTKAAKMRAACGKDADNCRLFKETNHTVRYGFKTFWEATNDLSLIGLPLTEEFVARDGYSTQYFARVVLRWKNGEVVTLRPLGQEAAKRQKLDTKPIIQSTSIPTYDESLFIPPAPKASTPGGPGPQQGGPKEIVVSISAQAMWAYEGGQQVMFSYVSTGRPGFDTPLGNYSVLVKYDSQTMEGVLGGEYYNVPDVPWVMYFTNSGHAIHGTYWHNNFGSVMSHGCVNLPMDVAAWMYSWAPIGTPVTIIG